MLETTPSLNLPDANEEIKPVPFASSLSTSQQISTSTSSSINTLLSSLSTECLQNSDEHSSKANIPSDNICQNQNIISAPISTSPSPDNGPDNSMLNSTTMQTDSSSATTPLSMDSGSYDALNTMSSATSTSSSSPSMILNNTLTVNTTLGNSDHHDVDSYIEDVDDEEAETSVLAGEDDACLDLEDVHPQGRNDKLVNASSAKPNARPADEGDNPPKSKRRRIHATASQWAILESSFVENPKPNADEKLAICEQTGLNSKCVRVLLIYLF